MNSPKMWYVNCNTSISLHHLNDICIHGGSLICSNGYVGKHIAMQMEIIKWVEFKHVDQVNPYRLSYLQRDLIFISITQLWL